jgi:hypothetical protein
VSRARWSCTCGRATATALLSSPVAHERFNNGSVRRAITDDARRLRSSVPHTF